MYNGMGRAYGGQVDAAWSPGQTDPLNKRTRRDHVPPLFALPLGAADRVEHVSVALNHPEAPSIGQNDQGPADLQLNEGYGCGHDSQRRAAKQMEGDHPAFNPTSTSRLIASAREGMPGCLARHWSTASSHFGGASISKRFNSEMLMAHRSTR